MPYNDFLILAGFSHYGRTAGTQLLSQFQCLELQKNKGMCKDNPKQRQRTLFWPKLFICRRLDKMLESLRQTCAAAELAHPGSEAQRGLRESPAN